MRSYLKIDNNDLLLIFASHVFPLNVSCISL